MDKYVDLNPCRGGYELFWGDPVLKSNLTAKQKLMIRSDDRISSIFIKAKKLYELYPKNKVYLARYIYEHSLV